MITAAIIVNPNAGHQNAPALARQAARVLKQKAWTVTVFFTERVGHAIQIAAQLAHDVSHIIVIGGDGALREVIVGLGVRKGAVVLGLIPLGHANVLAHELGISLDPHVALDTIARNATQRLVDVGRVGEHVFLSMIGVSYDARVVQFVERVRHSRLRFLYRLWADGLYLLFGCAAVFLPPASPLRLSVDQEPSPRLHGLDSIVVCNTRSYAKRMAITPEAECSDRQLNYQARKWLGGVGTLGAIISALRQHPAPAWIAQYGVGQHMIISAPTPFVWQADGDFMGHADHLIVELDPQQVRIIV